MSAGTTITTAEAVEIASRLRLGVTRLARKLRQEAEPGLTPSLLSALAAVERAGRLTVGELCAAEQVQPPTMTRFVAALSRPAWSTVRGTRTTAASPGSR